MAIHSQSFRPSSPGSRRFARDDETPALSIALFRALPEIRDDVDPVLGLVEMALGLPVVSGVEPVEES